MTTPRKRWPRVLGVLAVILVPAYLWFFVQVPGPSGDWTFDIAEVRKLAGSIEGDKPTELRVERVGDFKFPHAVLRAGAGWGLQPMQVYSYQLVFPTHSAIVDTALTEPLPGGSLNTPALERMVKGLNAADLIVVTHEHGDHLGGLVAQPNLPQLLKAAKLTREQVDHPELLEPSKMPPKAYEGYQPISYDKYLAVAPGVVLAKAPGHTPGSQIVYVQRADGTEYLFLGDVAWALSSVEDVAERPRAVGLIIGEDRGHVVRQLEQLRALMQAEPKLHLIAGHDPGPVNALVAQHLLEEQFK